MAHEPRDQLIESHLPLVKAVARRYAGRGEAIEDLVQVGAVGLIKASNRFDHSRGVSFASFAAPAVEGEIRRYLGDSTTSLRIPRELQRMAGQLQRCRTQLHATNGRLPTVAELASALGVDEDDVEQALKAERAREVISISDEATPELLDESEPLAASDDRVELARGMHGLNERERRIVFLRFHADMTEREIARTVGLSQAHVSRLLGGALVKLREQLDGGDITSERVISAGKGHPNLAKTQPDDTCDVRIEPVGVSQTNPEVEPDAAKRKASSGHSGRFLVRMPSELHEELSHAAEREQVSLNRFITDVLAESVGESPGSRGAASAKSATTDATPSSRAIKIALATNLVVVVVAGVAALALLILAVQRGI